MLIKGFIARLNIFLHVPRLSEDQYAGFRRHMTHENLVHEQFLALFFIVMVLIELFTSPTGLLHDPLTGHTARSHLERLYLLELGILLISMLIATAPQNQELIRRRHFAADITAETLLIMSGASRIFLLPPEQMEQMLEIYTVKFNLLLLLIMLLINQSWHRALPLITAGWALMFIGLHSQLQRGTINEQDLLRERFFTLFIGLAAIIIAQRHLVGHLTRYRNKRIIEEQNRLLEKSNDELIEANRLLEELSAMDGLTGIPNRRSFDRHIAEEWRRARRHATPLALLMLDIDRFKQYNDTYGHQEGDVCLRNVAQALQQQIRRPGEMVARYGGEEFAIIVPRCTISEAQVLGERLLAAIRALHIPHAALPGKHVTLSAGAAVMTPPPDLSFADLVHQADEALYRAKNEGRDRLVHD